MRPKVDTPLMIIGASLSGSALALRLARLGLQVFILDKSHFPRSKPCGEGLSPSGYRELNDLLPNFVFSPTHSRVFSGYRIIRNNALVALHHESDPLSGAPINGLGIQRSYLDHLLLTQALATGRVSLECGQVFNITDLGDRVRVSWKSKGIERTTETNLVAVCSGSQGQRLAIANKTSPSELLLKHKRRYLSPAHQERKRYGTRVLLEGNVALLPPEITMLPLSSAQAFFTPVGEDCLNLSVLSDKGGICSALSGKSGDDAIKRICDLIEFEGRIVERAAGSGPFSPFNTKSQLGRVFFLGDSRHQYDAISGMGMTHALASARLAAQSLSSLLEAEFNTASVEYYGTLYRHNIDSWSRYLRGFSKAALSALTVNDNNRWGQKFSDSLSSSTLANEAFRLVHWGLSSSSLKTRFSGLILTLSGMI